LPKKTTLGGAAIWVHPFFALITGREAVVADGFEVLSAQHREVERLFDQYRAAPDDAVAREICEKLTLHAEIEEKALYPEMRRLVDDGDDLADVAEAEHAVAKTIVARVYDSPPDDLQPLIAELQRVVTTHVTSEEERLFPAMAESGVDAEVLADRLEAATSEVSSRL
jgi:hemerythrin superfamily protein